MSSGPETRLRKKIVIALKKEWPYGYFRKIHGGAFQNIGIPDLFCCVEGIFFGLEIKIPKKKATPAQVLEIKSIRAAGGVAGVIYSPEQAVNGVRKALASKRSVGSQ